MDVSCREDDLDAVVSSHGMMLRAYKCTHLVDTSKDGSILEMDFALLDSLVVFSKGREVRDLGNKFRFIGETKYTAQLERVQAVVGLIVGQYIDIVW